MTDMTQLDELLTIQEKATSKIKDSNILAEMEEVQAKLEEASDIKDSEERNRVTEILEAKMDTLRASAQAEEKDLAEAVLGLNVFIEGLGGSYDELTQLSDSEKAIIERANKRLVDAEADLTTANGKWLFKDAAIESATAELNAAKIGITDAESKAKSEMRKRLLSASMEDSLQEFQLRVSRTVDIMKARFEEIQAQVKAVGARKKAAFAEKEKQAELLEKATSALEEVEANLYSAETELEGLANGSKEHTAQQQVISELKSKKHDAETARDVALGLFQSKEKFAKELEVHEAAQKKLRGNQLVWIKTLESDTEERIITFQSRLEAMKASSDQEIAKQLDDLGAEVDQSNAEFMAKVTVASDRIMADKVGAHPERFAKMQETQDALTQHIAKAGDDMKEMVESMQSQYGIDPRRSRFSHYEEEKSAA